MYVESDPIGLRGGSYSTYAYTADNPLRYADPFGLCKVVLDFSRPISWIPGYHISITTSDSQGMMWFAGGPTTHLAVNPRPDATAGWGLLWGSSGVPDKLPSGPNTHVVLDDGKPCDCYNKSFKKSINTINAAGLEYDPLSENSNSLAYTLLNGAGINAPDTWPNWTPGYGVDLQQVINGVPLIPYYVK
jgi:hypothetical protein